MEARVKAHTRRGKHGFEMVREYQREYEGILPENFPLTSKVTFPDFDKGTLESYNAVAEASRRLINEQLKHKKLEKYEGLLRRGLFKLGQIVRDKLDIKKDYKEIKVLGKKYGPVFVAYAIALEVIEDIILPAIAIEMGRPEAVPVLLAWHSEWFMWPLYFGVHKLLHKHKKLEKAFYYIMETK
jgi:hypothetical protein